MSRPHDQDDDSPRSALARRTAADASEQFDALRPEQFVGRNRYELINGVLVVSPPPGIGERSLQRLTGVPAAAISRDPSAWFGDRSDRAGADCPRDESPPS